MPICSSLHVLWVISPPKTWLLSRRRNGTDITRVGTLALSVTLVNKFVIDL